MKSMAKVPGKRAHTSCPADANVLFDVKKQSSALSGDIATALPGSDKKVRDFQRVEVTPEESARRVMVEATRLASLAPGEWRLWIDRSAERLRIPRTILEDVIAAIIKDSEKKVRDAETAARRHELAVRREQQRKQREQKREQEPDSGKSTLLGVLRFLVPKPFVSVEPTGPSVYRTVDREHPTLIIDEADDLFYRKSDLRAIVNAG